MQGKYAVRYLVEQWNKPRPEGGKKVRDGIVLSDDNHGYADAVFVASVMKTDDGEIGSILLLDSDNGHLPSRTMLEAVRDQINHHLEHHT